MASVTSEHEIPRIVRQKLGQVRCRIRAYVWLEGVAIVVAFLAAAFWIGLLLDWMFEPPAAVRAIAVIAVAAATLWLVYRVLLRRVFAPLPNSSLAVLLERRFRQLNDHLLTSVDLAADGEHANPYHPELVSRTNAAAAAAMASVSPGKVFRRDALVRALVVAALLAGSIGIFALASRETFAFWLDRIALSSEPWPRRVHLDVVGFPPDTSGQRTQKLALDDDFELLVHASSAGYTVPSDVEIRFQLADGRRGRDTMIRVGEAVPGRDEYQVFRYEFKNVAADMTFDIVGGDDRVRDLRLAIVDRPQLVGMEIECMYPEYLARSTRRLPVTGGIRIPEGSQLTFHATSTKPLTEVRIGASRTSQDVSLSRPAGDTPWTTINWNYGTLTTDDVLTIHMIDEDGVASREPYRVSLSVVPDELPQIAVRLDGIGTAITSDATLPIAGKVSDEYGLQRAWFAYRLDEGTADRERPLAAQPAGQQAQEELGAFDLRGSDELGGPRAIQPQPGQTLYLSLRATDAYDLSDAERVGASQEFALDVVTPAQLLALMERRELELRQRFEAIYAKMTDTRNLLARIDFQESASATDETEASQATSEGAINPTLASDEQRALARRRLRVAGSHQNVTQSAHEVIGVAEGFEDIYAQLENNRIDNTDLKSRLKEQIAQPLRQIGEARMTELESQLQLVEAKIADPTAAEPALAAAIRTADAILVDMQHVLERMLELESYNEVVALLRGIIHDQQNLNERTKQRQTDRLQDLLDE
jgi:hypothetical protein